MPLLLSRLKSERQGLDVLKLSFIVFLFLSFSSFSATIYHKNFVSGKVHSLDLSYSTSTVSFCQEIALEAYNSSYSLDDYYYNNVPSFYPAYDGMVSEDNSDLYYSVSGQIYYEANLDSVEYVTCLIRKNYFSSDSSSLSYFRPVITSTSPDSPSEDIPSCSSGRLWDSSQNACVIKKLQFISSTNSPVGSSDNLDNFCKSIHRIAGDPNLSSDYGNPYFATEHYSLNPYAYYDKEPQFTIDDSELYGGRSISASDEWSVSYVPESINYSHTGPDSLDYYDMVCTAYIRARYKDTNELINLSKFSYAYEVVAVENCQDGELYNYATGQCYLPDDGNVCPVGKSLSIYPLNEDASLLLTNIVGNDGCEILVKSATLVDKLPYFSKPEFKDEYRTCYSLDAYYTGNLSSSSSYILKEGDFCYELEEPDCAQGYSFSNETLLCEHSLGINNSYDPYDSEDPYNPESCSTGSNSCGSEIPYERDSDSISEWPTDENGDPLDPICSLDDEGYDRCYNPETADPAPISKYPEDSKISDSTCLNGYYGDTCSDVDEVQLCYGVVVSPSYDCGDDGIYTVSDGSSSSANDYDIAPNDSSDSLYDKANDGEFSDLLNERFENIRTNYQNSRFGQWVNSFASISGSSDECIEFSLDLSSLESLGIEVSDGDIPLDCKIWEILRIALLLMSLAYARSLIFGG